MFSCFVIWIFSVLNFLLPTNQELQMKFMDGRIKLMNEILSGVKILKFYAWEEAFLRKVGVLREGELKNLKRSQILYAISLASFNSSSFLVSLASAWPDVQCLTSSWWTSDVFFFSSSDCSVGVRSLRVVRWAKRSGCSEDICFCCAHQHSENSSESTSLRHEHDHAGQKFICCLNIDNNYMMLRIIWLI